MPDCYRVQMHLNPGPLWPLPSKKIGMKTQFDSIDNFEGFLVTGVSISQRPHQVVGEAVAMYCQCSAEKNNWQKRRGRNA